MEFLRMRYGFLILACATALLVSCKDNPTENKAEEIESEKPNLLYIFPDQLRNAAIGINDADPVYTPNLDQLVKEGRLRKILPSISKGQTISHISYPTKQSPPRDMLSLILTAIRVLIF